MRFSLKQTTKWEGKPLLEQWLVSIADKYPIIAIFIQDSLLALAPDLWLKHTRIRLGNLRAIIEMLHFFKPRFASVRMIAVQICQHSNNLGGSETIAACIFTEPC